MTEDQDMEDQRQPVPEEDQEPRFDLSPEDATALDSGPAHFNRKRVLIALCVGFSVIIAGGLIFNLNKSSKKKNAEQDAYVGASSGNNEFLSSLQNRAINNSRREAAENPPPEPEAEEEPKPEPEPLLPPVSFARTQNGPPQPPGPTPPPPANAENQSYAGSGGAQQQEPTHFKSSLVPPIQGRLFANAQQNVQAPAAAQQPDNPYGNTYRGVPAAGQASDYAAQNNQDNKQAFYDSASGGAVFNGQYLGNNSLWTGTIIPGVLETAINTDLPGNILARVTANVYDSQTGRNLLVPQGTLLIARYNSNVSYAQKRVQIVWDTLIRPDGYQIDLDGANGTDRAGMSGQPAQYHENWAEYVKAAAIVTVFSMANSSLTETAAKYASNERAAGVAEANTQMVNQLGGNIVSRAMNIQPTLTVDNGTVINIMLNKTLFLPPLDAYPASQKYRLE